MTDIQLWQVPDCPLADRVRAMLRRCLDQAMLTGPATIVHEVTGDYPSPTLLVDGIDVATGNPPSRAICCRLDLPTEQQILAALTGTA